MAILPPPEPEQSKRFALGLRATRTHRSEPRGVQRREVPRRRLPNELYREGEPEGASQPNIRSEQRSFEHETISPEARVAG